LPRSRLKFSSAEYGFAPHLRNERRRKGALAGAQIAAPAFDKQLETLLNDWKSYRLCAGRRRCVLATTVEAPMVGKILRIEKNVGDRVDEDEVIIVMEAMKMEIPIVAPTSGTVKEISVSAGQAVEAEQQLAVIE
jgi:biotin carboxyl carrier protein